MTELEIVKAMGNMNIFPGTRVKVYDPLDGKYKTGTVIKRYGLTENHSITCPYKYPDLCDVSLDTVRFPYIEGEERYLSRGHFTYGVQIL